MIDLKDIPPLLDEATAMLKRDNDAAERVFIYSDPKNTSDFFFRRFLEWHDDKRDNDAADQVFIGVDPASGSDLSCKATFRGDTLISLEWSDDKPDERADRHITTGPGDLGFDQKPILR